MVFEFSSYIYRCTKICTRSYSESRCNNIFFVIGHFMTMLRCTASGSTQARMSRVVNAFANQLVRSAWSTVAIVG